MLNNQDQKSNPRGTYLKPFSNQLKYQSRDIKFCGTVTSWYLLKEISVTLWLLLLTIIYSHKIPTTKPKFKSMRNILRTILNKLVTKIFSQTIHATKPKFKVIVFSHTVILNQNPNNLVIKKIKIKIRKKGLFFFIL